MWVYRIEFLQPDGRWTGPYVAEYMTAKAFALRDAMMKDHEITRPYPISATFAHNPGLDRYVCASPSLMALRAWFGAFLPLLQEQGGHIGVYEVPTVAIAEQDDQQVVYMQRQAVCLSRKGTPVNSDLLVARFHPDKAKATKRTRIKLFKSTLIFNTRL